jgi:hypothetical protein
MNASTLDPSILPISIDRETPHGDPRLSNPFEDFETIYPAPVVKAFVITEEMRQRDAVEQREKEIKRQASITWTPPFPRRVVEQVASAPYILAPGRGPKQRVIRTLKFCEAGCGAEVMQNTKTGICRACYMKRGSAVLPKEMCSAGCGKPLTRRSSTGKCRGCALKGNPQRHKFRHRVTGKKA